MHSTSVSADSSTSTVVVSSPSRSCLTIGMTTADEVPPRVAPVASARGHERSSAAVLTTETMATVTPNERPLSTSVERADRISEAAPRDSPLSKRMMVSAIVLAAAPAFPKSSGTAVAVAGPRRIPTAISSRTSGTRVCLKTTMKRLAASRAAPMTRTTRFERAPRGRGRALRLASG